MVKLAANVTDNATSVLAPYGLLSPAVKVIEDNDPHWQNGFTYDTLGCAGTTSIHSVCVSASATSVSATGEQFRKYRPFTVRTTFACSTMSRTPEELETLAKNELDIVLQKAIEKEFQGGVLAEAEATAVADAEELPNRYLSDDEAVSLSGTAVKPRLGLALLEGAIGTAGNGAQGVIHAPRSAIEAMSLPISEGGVLRTKLDTPVVAGVGYEESAGDTTVTLYGTSAVTVRLGPVVVIPEKVSQAVNRANNTTTYYVERVAAVTWDSCAHYSVSIDLTLDY
jgi:hypothetical protein